MIAARARRSAPSGGGVAGLHGGSQIGAELLGEHRISFVGRAITVPQHACQREGHRAQRCGGGVAGLGAS